jgi:hypothetical protein
MVVAFYGELGQFMIEGFMVAVVSGLMMASELIAAIDLRILIAIYVPMALYIIYLVYYYRRQNRMLKRHGKLLNDDEVPLGAMNLPKMRKSRRQRHSWVADETIRHGQDDMWTQVTSSSFYRHCKLVYDVSRGRVTEVTKEHKAKNQAWLNMNRHNKNQAYASHILKGGTGFSSQHDMLLDASEVNAEDTYGLRSVDYNYLEESMISTIPAEIRDMTHFMSSFLVLQGKFEGLDIRMSSNLFDVKLPKKLTAQEDDRTIDIRGPAGHPPSVLQRVNSRLTLQRVSSRFTLGKKTSSTTNVMSRNRSFKNLMTQHSQFNVLDEEEDQDLGHFESFIYMANRSTFTKSAATKYREKHSVSTDVDKALARIIHSVRVREGGVTNTVSQLLLLSSGSSQSCDLDGMPIMMNTQLLREEFNAMWNGFYPAGAELNDEERKEADECFIAWAKTQSSDYMSGSRSGSESVKLSGGTFSLSPRADVNLISACTSEVSSRGKGSSPLPSEDWRDNVSPVDSELETKDSELVDEKRISMSLVRSVTSPTFPLESDDLHSSRVSRSRSHDDLSQHMRSQSPSVTSELLDHDQDDKNVSRASKTFSAPLITPGLGRHHSMVRNLSSTVLYRAGSDSGSDAAGRSENMYTGRSGANERSESNGQSNSRRSTRSDMPLEVNTVAFSHWFRAIVAEAINLRERDERGANMNSLSDKLSQVSKSFRFPKNSLSRRKSSMPQAPAMTPQRAMHVEQRVPKLSAEKIKQIKQMTAKKSVTLDEEEDDLDEFIATTQAEWTSSAQEPTVPPFSPQEGSGLGKRRGLLSFAGDSQERLHDLNLDNDVDLIAENFVTISGVGSDDDDYFAESKTYTSGYDEAKGATPDIRRSLDLLRPDSFDEMTGSLYLPGNPSSGVLTTLASAFAPSRSQNVPSASRTSSDGSMRTDTSATKSSSGYYDPNVNLNGDFGSYRAADTATERNARRNRVDVAERDHPVDGPTDATDDILDEARERGRPDLETRSVNHNGLRVTDNITAELDDDIAAELVLSLDMGDLTNASSVDADRDSDCSGIFSGRFYVSDDSGDVPVGSPGLHGLTLLRAEAKDTNDNDSESDGL